MYSINSSHSVPPPSQHQLALVSALPPPASLTAKEKEKERSPPSSLASAQPSASPQPPSATPLPDPPLSTSVPSTTGSESRRRNAEQRAAQLRADPLLAQVEPHRVFCALCRKWVQLRQDSTFCAYPWQQHRSKCVIRQSVTIIFFGFNCAYHSILNFPFLLCSDKKTTKIKAIESVTTTHSGRATPAAASGDESTDNYELGAEGPGEEMDTTIASTEDAVMFGPEGDAVTDKLATRYANLNSPTDRYVCFPSPPFHSFVMSEQFAYCSLSHLPRHCIGILRATCHCQCHFLLLAHLNRLLGGDVLLPPSLPRSSCTCSLGWPVCT